MVCAEVESVHLFQTIVPSSSPATTSDFSSFSYEIGNRTQERRRKVEVEIERIMLNKIEERTRGVRMEEEMEIEQIGEI